MNTELISAVEILKDGELLLRLESGGKSSYQYVYRAAAGVYWDGDRQGFKFSTQKDGKYAQWFNHIVKVVRDEINLNLQLSEHATWKSFPEEDKYAIYRAAI